MTWVIIIIIIGIVLFIAVNAKNKKEVERYYNSKGGFKNSFPTFTNHLENVYGMNFENDTGRSFVYSKKVYDTSGNDGTLFVGVKLNMAGEPIMFTKFQSKYKGNISGMDISRLDYNNVQAIDKCIQISVDEVPVDFP